MTVRGLITAIVFLPGLAAGGPQFQGTRVDSVSVEEISPNPQDAPHPAEVARNLLLRPGEIITDERLRDSIHQLYATGQFSSIEIDARPAAGATHLTYRLLPVYHFGSIQLEDNDHLSRPLSAYLRLPVGERHSATAIERLVSDVRDVFRNEGYYQVQLQSRIEFQRDARLAIVTLNASTGPRAVVRSVQALGGEQTFERKEVLDRFGIDVGSTLSEDALDRGVTRVDQMFSDLGFFNTRVTAEQDYNPTANTVDLVVRIEPGLYTLVQIRGFDISRSKTREILPVFAEGRSDPELIEEGRTLLLRHLQQLGYFNAIVRSELIEDPDNNAAQVNYSVTAGARYRVRSVSVNGTRRIPLTEIEPLLQVRPAGLLSRGVFSADLLETDIRTISSFYRSRGFEDIEVRGAIEGSETNFSIRYDVSEGTTRSIRQIHFEGNQRQDRNRLLGAIPIQEGETYSPGAVDDARTALTSYYHANGFPDVEVNVNIQRVEDQTADVHFLINEGPAFTIGKIFVSGNTLTKEKIVHRNSQLYPNTPYNPENILQAQQRLYATGLFSRVEIRPLAEERPGVRNVLIQLEDANPLLLTYGLGLQDREGPRGTVEISHINLFGLDRNLNFRLRGSRREQRLVTTYREPRLFNRDFDGFASIFLERANQRFFDANRVDFSMQTLRKLGPQQSLLVTASYQTVNLRDIRVNRLATRFPDEIGVIQIARIGGSLLSDTRNDPIDPSKGMFTTTTFQLAARKLGSEVNFTSFFTQNSFYRSAGPAVAAGSFRFGWNQPFGRTKSLPITERYFAGGSTTLRGFDLDKALEGGGNALAIGNVELRFPVAGLPFSGVGGAIFYDVGNAFPLISDVELRRVTHTAGIGLRYQTPLGPVRVDAGFNLRRRTGEDRYQLFFTLGHTF